MEKFRGKIQWRAIVLHVDLETGEQLTKYRATGKNTIYKKIQTIKNATKIEGVRGTIEYVNGYIRNPQQRIFD